METQSTDNPHVPPLFPQSHPPLNVGAVRRRQMAAQVITTIKPLATLL